MDFQANCQTTAMGIMPHTDIGRALELSLSLDIPFWPQLPRVSYFEDMYVQASEYFPGIIIDVENQKISLDSAKFANELAEYSEKMADPLTFTLSDKYSVVYRQFLSKNLVKYSAIRGQVIGPVSFGFKVFDENNMPIIYNESIRTLLFDFLSRKINAQYTELKERNEHAFVWMDEPGLGWVFSGFSGYDDFTAKREYGDFLKSLTGPSALHLCANVNLPYLLSIGTNLLSFDAYQIEILPKGYASAIAGFLKNGGIISWGIVPTDSSALANETPERLSELLHNYWRIIADNTDISMKQIAQQALIAPARCCLKNMGRVGASDEKADKSKSCTVLLHPEEKLVETAFMYLKMMSKVLRKEFSLYN
ncbi:MAG: hypothetical protein V1767_05575 [Chloroflexota bacterium]